MAQTSVILCSSSPRLELVDPRGGFLKKKRPTFSFRKTAFFCQPSTKFSTRVDLILIFLLLQSTPLEYDARWVASIFNALLGENLFSTQALQ